MQLAGSHVLVTGASRGIGHATAEALAAEGARLSLVARSAEPLDALARRVGGRAHPADLRSPAGLVERVEADGGPLDAVISAAALPGIGRFADRSADELAGTLAVNLGAPAELARQALPGMVSRGRGRLVHVSSVFAQTVAPGAAAYAASKAGLSHLSALLRAELTGTDVGVTTVEFGPVGTAMYDEFVTDYPPLAAAMRRFERLAGVVPVERAAAAIVDALARDRDHVTLPRRLAPVSAYSDLPRRVSRRIAVARCRPHR